LPFVLPGWATIMLDTTVWTEEQHKAAKAEFELYKAVLRPFIRDAQLGLFEFVQCEGFLPFPQFLKGLLIRSLGFFVGRPLARLLCKGGSEQTCSGQTSKYEFHGRVCLMFVSDWSGARQY
jgi:hypothetical protein